MFFESKIRQGGAAEIRLRLAASLAASAPLNVVRVAPPLALPQPWQRHARRQSSLHPAECLAESPAECLTRRCPLTLSLQLRRGLRATCAACNRPRNGVFLAARWRQLRQRRPRAHRARTCGSRTLERNASRTMTSTSTPPPLHDAAPRRWPSARGGAEWKSDSQIALCEGPFEDLRHAGCARRAIIWFDGHAAHRVAPSLRRRGRFSRHIGSPPA